MVLFICGIVAAIYATIAWVVSVVLFIHIQKTNKEIQALNDEIQQLNAEMQAECALFTQSDYSDD
ncbi:MAG: hypothetical protein J1E81_10335 [Eubacterium sp.]|nr:hypothetical protein [Eubacterium sp.]